MLHSKRYWPVVLAVLSMRCWLALGASDFQVWSQIVPVYHAPNSLNFGAIVQWRFGRGNADKFLTDLNVEKGWDSGFSVSGGLATLSLTHPLFSRLEWRPWLGGQHRTELGGASWVNRLRAEFRFLPMGTPMSLRFRLLSGITYPFDDQWAFVADEEIFINVNTVSTTVVAGFPENRFRIGFRYQPISDLNFDVAYMNQWVFDSNRVSSMVHNLAVFAQYGFR